MQMDIVAHDGDASADSVPSAQAPQGTLWLAFPPPSCAYHWFSRGGCVLRGEDDERRVFVGGTLIGTFGPRERPVRNALLIALSASPEVHLGKLCEAFGVSDETRSAVATAAPEQGHRGGAGAWSQGQQAVGHADASRAHRALARQGAEPVAGSRPDQTRL